MDFSTFDELFAIDDTKADSGVPIEAGINRKDEPIIFYISDISRPEAQKMYRKFEKAFESCRHLPKKRTLVWARFLANSVLKDWKGVIDLKGKEIPATVENKIAVLTRYEKFLNIVLEEANRTENFRPDSNHELTPEEDTEKN